MLVAFAAMLVLAFGLVWVAGCGSSSTETTATTTATTASTTTSVTEATTTTGAPTTTASTVAKLDKLTLVAPPGPMAIPLAYMAVNDKLADVAEKTELVVWENADQLKAMVAGGQGDFVTIPSNTSAIFYNKGLEMKLLDISVWNITYLITTDPDATSFTDIKGQSLVVSFQGSVPDVMFQYIATKEGLDPQKDFELQYATDPTQAAQLLLSGKVKNAVLERGARYRRHRAEPIHGDAALPRARFRQGLGSGGGRFRPQSHRGHGGHSHVMDKPEVVAAFVREYQAAVDWMLANPEEAGTLVETELPQLGLKAALMTASLQNITWKFTPAVDARASLEAFYTALSELSPEVIGGKLPDDGFYYAP